MVTPNPTGVCQAPLLTSRRADRTSYIQALRDLINSTNNVTVILNPNGSIPLDDPDVARLDQHDRPPSSGDHRPPGRRSLRSRPWRRRRRRACRRC